QRRFRQEDVLSLKQGPTDENQNSHAPARVVRIPKDKAVLNRLASRKRPDGIELLWVALFLSTSHTPLHWIAWCKRANRAAVGFLQTCLAKTTCLAVRPKTAPLCLQLPRISGTRHW